MDASPPPSIEDAGPMQQNPYQAPESNLAPPSTGLDGSSLFGDGSPEVVRRRYLARETRVRTIGLVYFLLGVFGLIGFGLAFVNPQLMELFTRQAQQVDLDPSVFRAFLIGVMVIVTAIVCTLGLELRNLRNWARWVVIILTIVGLLSRLRALLNPAALTPSLATLVALLSNGISLFMVVSLFKPDTPLVCSKFYRSVVAETLRVRPSMATTDWVLLYVCCFNGILGLVMLFIP